MVPSPPATANPAVFISSETQYVLAGTSTDIEASVYANPTLDEIQWYHGGELVNRETEPRYSFDNGGEILRIESIDEELLGRYEVVVRIGNQSASDDIILAIPGQYNCTYSSRNVCWPRPQAVCVKCTHGKPGDKCIETAVGQARTNQHCLCTQCPKYTLYLHNSELSCKC